jgi:hypothetical protein
MREAGAFPNLKHDIVQQGSKILCKLEYIDNLWYIEINRPRDLVICLVKKLSWRIPTSSKLVVLKGDMQQWHDCYRYISFKALEKLPTAVQGIKITDILTRESFRKAYNSYYTCRLSKVDQQIS